MTERFKRYLEEQFRAIPPTKAAMDYRKATLVRLEEYAQDARIKGMTDEDAIYNLAIDSLGDFHSVLVKFNEDLNTRPKKMSARLVATLSVCLTIIFVVGLYLVLSLFNVIPWRTSWLILVGAVFAAVISVMVLSGIKMAKNKSYAVPRVFLAGSIVLASTFIYLVLLMATSLPYTWYTFLVMVILILSGDTAVAFLAKSKLAIVESQAAFATTCALLYVMLGVAHAMPWHPGWLLPALGLSLAVTAIILTSVQQSSSKKLPRAKKNEAKPTEVDEKYYTDWQ